MKRKPLIALAVFIFFARKGKHKTYTTILKVQNILKPLAAGFTKQFQQ